MRPAAGGETGAPRAQRGTRLKATTERAFLVSLALQRSTPKRLVHLCLACGTGCPAPIQGSKSGEKARACAVSPSHGPGVQRLARCRRPSAQRGWPNVNLGRPALELG